MAEVTFVSHAECAASKSSCKELRSVENQNIVLQLRSTVRDQMDEMFEEMRASMEVRFDEMRARIDARFKSVLEGMGYVEQPGQHPAVTAVPADTKHHPDRRVIDESWKARLFSWMQRNGSWLLALAMALLAGAAGRPWFSRIAEAITVWFEKALAR